jgi:hypothetical protein
MPLGKLVEVKAILPFVPPQVVVFVAVPTVRVGAAGSVNTFEVANVPTQLLFVTEKALYVPAFRPVKEKALPDTVMLCGLVVAPAPVAVKLNE